MFELYASGNYSFPGLATGNYLVRAVSDSVSSSRTGWVNTLRAVQTYRTDARDVDEGTPAAPDSAAGAGVPPPAEHRH